MKDCVDSLAPRPARPTLRDVARASGVSAMTVSRVLRNQAAVSDRVRGQVLAAAGRLGYRPDPYVAKLMHHLRSRRKPVFQGSIYALTTQPADAPFQTYSAGIVLGARRQAEVRGFGFGILRVTPENAGPGCLQRMLRSRGIEGVLLLPMVTPSALTSLIEWREFSVIATTSSVLAPAVHGVIPHHFKNAQLLCAQLAARGYRRIGIVLPAHHVARVHHAYNAAIVWHGLFHHGTFVPPLIYAGQEPRQLTAWFARERPDAIVTHTPQLCHTFAATLGLAVPGPVGFASTNTTPESDLAGIDELSVDIGVAAIDLLTGMIQRGEKGVPAVPTTTQVQGRWVDGASCPARAPGPGSLPRTGGSRLICLEE